ncbi:hypothetical protein EN858_14890 [Mesorhizobium sp. M4B.F.Ca.ET.215.01.1.1]|uniref:hypothetical protein n=1 Tax=unclassified Mesorhizobium TaxID=325217 RepID=UPI001093E7D3|nr:MULTISPECIES: hypothetical protein [unclassified Mesorhizobium]TGQ11206.1 hypothetical protein EN858_14890 [Mesorhizobium sp. M4B.F.Ca.ET.215.01.1.1]TGR04741.1 hypothetical protein EN846_13190 [Mesorhizobium sp. M4B.F.Ca.ET.203.01.1.1]
MDQQAYLELTRMLEGFPLTAGNPDLTISAFELAIQGLSPAAIIEAARRFNAGLVEGQSADYAPTPARFAQEARKRQEHANPKPQRSLPVPRYFPGPLAPFQIRQQKRLAENANRKVLFEGINFDQWKKLSANKEVPTGAIWIASLGIVYGPANSQAAAE